MRHLILILLSTLLLAPVACQDNQSPARSVQETSLTLSDFLSGLLVEEQPSILSCYIGKQDVSPPFELVENLKSKRLYTHQWENTTVRLDLHFKKNVCSGVSLMFQGNRNEVRALVVENFEKKLGAAAHAEGYWYWSFRNELNDLVSVEVSESLSDSTVQIRLH